jgi:hypothetical protein
MFDAGNLSTPYERSMSRTLRTTCRLVALLVLCGVRAAVAQAPVAVDSTGPREGAWGAELSSASLYSASLLHFTSRRSAWLLGGSFGFSQQHLDEFDGTANRQRSVTSGSFYLQGGLRWWPGASIAPFRPLVGVGAISGLTSGSGGGEVTGGVYGEVGGSYFFGPHASLGVTSQLTLQGGQGHHGNDETSDSWFIRGEIARFNASVYF